MTIASLSEGQTISFYVDDELLDRRADSVHTAPGVVGFRTHGAERGLVHDVTVTSAGGTVLIDTTFPAGDRTFTAGTVTDGNLHVSGNAEAWYPIPDDVPLLRKGFTVADKVITNARIYASAQGVYEMRLNGEQVGDHELAPGWTDYRKRIQYQTYDVTDLVAPGSNAVGAQLAGGWFSGKVGMFGGGIYGDQNAFIAQLRIEYADGSVQVVDTDATWRTTPGPIVGADILDGERYDARRAEALGGWSRGGYDDSGWAPVVVRPSVTERLEPQTDQPVRATQELSATRLPSPSPGTYVYDLGQNMVGHVRVTLNGEPGHTVRIRHAEVLNPDGSLYVDNLRTAKATDYYTLAGTGPETYEPSFTFHGFRYVEITGLDEAPDESAITGVVVGTDGGLVSEFSTSSDMVNQLHSNIVWGMRGNFLSIPTDTPARDERLGWTGDINVFARTAVSNMDSQAFLSKWLQDLRDT
jgi:alpha-L-rhamnosidase